MQIKDHRLVNDNGAPTEFRPSANHGGTLKPRFLVMHYTAGRSADASARWLCNPVAKASAHVVIGNPGKLIRQGAGYRSLSLGTEYSDNDVIVATHKHQTTPAGWHVYPTTQLEVAFEVASLLVQHYGLKDVIGHEDIAPQRKSDPGPAFPMESFRTRLYGRAEDE